MGCPRQATTGRDRHFSLTARFTPTSSKATGSIVFLTAARGRSPSCKPRARSTIPTDCGAFGPNKLLMVEGETKGNFDLITIDGDNAKIETIKVGFDELVSFVQVGDLIRCLTCR